MSEGDPVWYEPTEWLLWHKFQRILKMITEIMSHRAQIYVSSRRPVRIPMLTTVLVTLEAAPRGMQELELDLGGVEEGCLVW